MMSLKVLFTFIELRLSKRLPSKKFELHCVSKTKMTVESPFRFDWIGTFKSKVKITAEGSLHFIALQLSSKSKLIKPFQIGKFFLKETKQILVVGFSKNVQIILQKILLKSNFLFSFTKLFPLHNFITKPNFILFKLSTFFRKQWWFASFIGVMHEMASRKVLCASCPFCSLLHIFFLLKSHQKLKQVSIGSLK